MENTKEVSEKKQCDIHVVSIRSFQELEHLAEELECANMYLDDLNIPRKDGSGEEYSIVGRIKYLENNGF
tara:strand:- start:366 stop:575 length:210 start_codon:yes stop_codon:yes gene_type:complete